MTSILYDRLAALLADTKEDDWRKLANQTGLHFAWIRSIAKGDTVRPSADKAELLIKAISGEIVCFKAG